MTAEEQVETVARAMEAAYTSTPLPSWKHLAAAAIAAYTSPAEEAVKRVEALCDEAEVQAEREGFPVPEDAAVLSPSRIRAALASPVSREPNDGPGPDGHHVVTGECFACMVGVSTGPESHGKRCALASPADAEKRAAAAALRDAWPSVWQVLDRHGQGRSAMTLEASHVVEARAAALDPQ